MNTASNFSRLFFTALCAGLLFFGLTAPAHAQQSTATQSIRLGVKPVTQIALSGTGVANLVIDQAESGAPTASATDNTSTYSLLTNVDNVRIRASIDADVPAGTRLELGLASSLGNSNGPVDLSSAHEAVEVVSGIQRGREVQGAITYRFIADLSQAGEIEPSPRTITFTIVN